MEPRTFDRRTFLRAAGASAAAIMAGCGLPDLAGEGSETDGRLDFALTLASVPRSTRDGVIRLGVTDERDTLLFVPSSAVGRQRVPVLMSLHGAAGGQAAALRRYRDQAIREGMALVVPASRGRTWDAVLGAFGPDVELIERSLDAAARAVPIHPRKIAIAGYADGASYALSLGLTNGDVFTHVIANSPASIPMPDPHGRPAVFVSHGTQDRSLPIRRTSDEIVANLEGEGYDVTYEQFAGGHTLPRRIATRAVEWFLAGS